MQLARGSVWLRQVAWTRTLLAEEEVQPIVPLGLLIQLGYNVRWEGTTFVLTDREGRVLDTMLEAGCPTVDEELGLELIKELEEEAIKQRMRLMVLNGEGLTLRQEDEVGVETAKWLKKLKQIFPNMPERILERLPPRRRWESVPWNRRIRRRLQQAEEIIIHLYSGPDARYWERELGTAKRVVLCVDMEIHENQNML